MAIEDKYQGKKVLVTGHTGFKGSWLCAWLLELGAEVAGYSIDIPTKPSHFEVIGLGDRIDHTFGDVCKRDELTQCIERFKPAVIFHLAAQPIVSASFKEPVKTFETNVLGTVNVLECIRKSDTIKAAVLITSDKCYRNVEWEWGYRENDALGGYDPYSASKGCAELAIQSYAHSFFQGKGPAIASTRAGNVIGGGDWAADRIVPDAMRAWSSGSPVTVRNPGATRPWQHVLEPLGGYLALGERLLQRDGEVTGEAFNFGPDAGVNQPVGELIHELFHYWGSMPEKSMVTGQAISGKESNLLKLCCDKALKRLGWQAKLSFSETARLTAEWYRVYYDRGKREAAEMTRKQILLYSEKQ